jgi:hypothetical protein
MTSAFGNYNRRIEHFKTLFNEQGRIRVQKKNPLSNLFRYSSFAGAKSREIQRDQFDISDFNRVLGIDLDTGTVDVEGMCSFHALCEHTLTKNLLPAVVPELKTITVGGAICGIGIESSGFRHGFVHDTLIEADVMLASGEIVTCSRDQNTELFLALANSYGTLGYVLRARLELMPAKPYVELRSTQFSTIEDYLDAMSAATKDPANDFIEGLAYDNANCFLFTGRFVDHAPDVFDIYKNRFYRSVSKNAHIYLTSIDYLFRYDPEWFWNLPDSWPFNLLRKITPAKLRCTNNYMRYLNLKRAIKSALKIPSGDSQTEPLIQDWEVTFDKGKEFFQYCQDNVPLGKYPWVVVPIKPRTRAPLYPLQPGELYLNIGCYCHVPKSKTGGQYHYTKLLDKKCFSMNGIKMLYSSTFLDETTFYNIYGGDAYARVKQQYDPGGLKSRLFEKVCQS